MAHTKKTSDVSLISLIGALGLCGEQLSFGRALFAGHSSGRTGWLLAEGHGDDEEDEEEEEQDEEEGDDEEDDEDDDEEPWQVRPLSECPAASTRPAGTPLCAPSPLAALQSRISP